MDDVKEISYARKVIIGDNELANEEKMKKERFALSFCNYEVESNEKSLGMWREYGGSGYGCGIVFEIDVEPMEDWQNCHLSKIYYSKNDLKVVKDAYHEYLKIQNEYNNVLVHGIEKIIVSVYCFHKSPIFDYEKELRLLYSHRSDVTTYNEKIYPCFKNGKSSSFIEIDLWYKTIIEEKRKANPNEPMPHFNNLLRVKPTINITKVVFGYKLTERERNEIKGIIIHYAKEIPGERIMFENSQLAQYYNVDKTE